MSVISFEVIYRGIFQKSLAVKISRTLILAAVKEGSRASPSALQRFARAQRIPAKQFGYIADNEEELETVAAQYEPKQVDISICVDDTLCKGVESWAWYGLQPINAVTKPRRHADRHVQPERRRTRPAHPPQRNALQTRHHPPVRRVLRVFGSTRTTVPTRAVWQRPSRPSPPCVR